MCGVWRGASFSVSLLLTVFIVIQCVSMCSLFVLARRHLKCTDLRLSGMGFGASASQASRKAASSLRSIQILAKSRDPSFADGSLPQRHPRGSGFVAQSLLEMAEVAEMIQQGDSNNFGHVGNAT